MTKAAIWNQLKTEYEYSSSLLNKLYGVTYQQASKELLESILASLENEVGQGVNEDLSSDVEEVTGNDLITDTNAPINQDEVNSSEDIWSYKIIQSSWNPDFYHMWMYEGEKGYWYFTTDTMVAEIKLEDLETKVSDLNSLASTKSVTVQSCGTWSNIFTCNDTELAKLLNSQYYSINRDSIMQRSLAVAEIHTQAIKQQDLLKQWQLEQDSSVATETSDNTYYALVHSQADEVYIVTPYCLNPKRLVDCKVKELKESLYHCKEVAADEANEWLGDNYQVVEVDYNNICCDIKAYFRDRVLVSQLNCYLPKDEAITKGYYYKGIPVEHFETMEDAWYSTFGNTNSDYLVIDLMTDYPGIVVFENISEEYTHSSILNTVTELKQYVGYSETYRGIEFSHSTKHNYTGYVDLLPGTVELKLGHYNFVKLANKKSLTAFEVSTMLEAVKQAKQWLGVKQQQVPSTETGNYHYSQMQLTPKLELFSLMTEFVFLMECYLELTTYFFNLSSSIYDANHQLFLTWNIICSICFKRYVCMPSKGDSTYGILLRIHNQAMKQSSLERKSIYA